MSEKSTIFKNSAVLAVISLISKSLGYARDALFAWFFGASAATDAYYSALRIITFFRKTAAEGNLNAALAFSVFSEANKENSKALYASAAAFIGFIFCAFIVAAYLLYFLLFPPVRKDFSDSFLFILAIMSPQIIFILLFSVWQVFLNSKGIFAYPALIHLFFSSSVIFSILMFKNKEITTACYLAASAGTISSFIQFFLFSYILKKNGETPRISFNLSLEYIKKTAVSFFSLIPSNYDYFIFTITMFFSSFEQAGALTAVYNASRLAQFPLSLSSSPAAAAAACEIAEHSSKGNIKERNKSALKALKISFLWTIPAAMGLMIMAEPISSFLFKRGAYEQKDIAITVLYLKIFASALPFISADKILISYFYACGKSRKAFAFLASSLLLISAAAFLFSNTRAISAYASLAVSTAGFFAVFLDKKEFIFEESSELFIFCLKSCLLSAAACFLAEYSLKFGAHILISVLLAAILYAFFSKIFLKEKK
ncbi:MAG: hypothetical protein GX447_02685 [Elusimicrobia bacterium]|nr:hypothetical protein [Elusimicrobiota bacterium]